MRIALVAMSGVRACDTELLELGLTLPGFVERSKTIASLPSLGLLTLAGLTPAEHDVSYHEVDDVRLPGVAEALFRRYDLVAISTFTAQAPESYAIADRFQAMGVPVVMGGLHVTALPDEALAHADAVVIGEGEVVWNELLQDAERGELQPRYDARGREFDLAESPMPRFELLDFARYNRITLQTTRGCPWKCAFCASSILLTPRYKHKPAGRVLAEVDAIRARWPRPFLEFADDNSFVQRSYWLELLPELAKRKTRWFTETDVRVGADDEMLGQMKRAGCRQVLVGIESPVEAGLIDLELKADFKRRKRAEVAGLIRNIQSHGIRVNGCYIVGLDGQDATVFDAVAEDAEALGLFDVQVTLPTPFPGTPLYRQLAGQGRLFDSTPWERCTLFDLAFEPDPMSAEQLRQGFRELAVRLYSDEATRRRRAAFRRQARRRAA